MSQFVLHPEAVEDLEDIWEFIAADNLPAADRFVEEIYEAIHSLARFPEMGSLRPDLSSRHLRFHPVGNFLIAYAPSKQPLIVVAVLHGRRNPRVIAALLRERE